MYNFSSCYYEKDIEIDGDNLQTLLDIYLKIMESQETNPDVSCVEEIDDSSIDTVLYHVENFGQDYPEYQDIKEVIDYINE